MSDVSHVVNPDDSQSLGVEVEGVFVPFITLSADDVFDKVARGLELQRRAAQGDEQALAVVHPTPPPAPPEPEPAPEALADAPDAGA